MTSCEATAGIGQRVSDTASGWVGTFQAIERIEPAGGSAYFVGLVEFGGSSRRVSTRCGRGGRLDGAGQTCSD